MIPKEDRNPLNKEKFLGGNRQRWTGILLLYSIIIAAFQIKFAIDPSPYISFALTIGSLFILGGSVDSFLQINAASTVNKSTKSTQTTQVTTQSNNEGSN
jgi:hypothetical protein